MSMMSLLSVLAGEAPASPMGAKRLMGKSKKRAPGFLAALFKHKPQKSAASGQRPLSTISRSSGRGIGDELLNRRR